MKLRICFEVSTMDGDQPCTFGMQLDLGETDKPIEYEALAKAINIDKLLAVASLDTIGVTKENLKIITPDEYDRLYGEDADEDG